MDTKLEKKQSKLKIILIVSAIAVAIVLFAVYFLKQKKTYNVPSDEIQISEVTYGKFEDMYNDAAEKVDEIAERILMLGGTPENKFSEYLKVAKVKEISGITCGGEAVEHILETYSYLIGEERKVIELANEAGDDATADLMTGYLKEQEKMVWMLVAFSTKSCAK